MKSSTNGIDLVIYTAMARLIQDQFFSIISCTKREEYNAVQKSGSASYFFIYFTRKTFISQKQRFYNSNKLESQYLV